MPYEDDALSTLSIACKPIIDPTIMAGDGKEMLDGTVVHHECKGALRLINIHTKPLSNDQEQYHVIAAIDNLDQIQPQFFRIF